MKNIKNFVDRAKKTAKIVMDNGLDFYNKTVEEVKQTLKTPEEKLDAISDAMNKDNSNEEKIKNIKEILGSEKTKKENDKSDEDDNTIEKLIQIISKISGQDAADIARGMCDSTKDKKESIRKLRSIINNSLS